MRFPAAAAVGLCLPSLLFGASRNRISGAIDGTDIRVVKGSVHRLANTQSDRGEVDPAMRLDHVMLLMRPTAAQQADMDQLLRDQQNPSSPDFHRWLSPEQYADRFGLSIGDHSKIIAWLTAHGFTANEPARGRNWIAFSGSAGQVSVTFHTSIHRYAVHGETHFANATEPMLPAGIADVVGGFAGLNDFNPKPLARVVGPPNFTSGTSHYLAPGDWSTIYNVAPLAAAGYDGAGQSIAVVGQSDIVASDISSFRTDFGLPANTVRQILFGADPGFTSAQTESNLDLEWSGAIAPRATLYYVISSNAFSALTYAVSQNLAPVISVSYAICENDSTPVYRSVAQQANAQGSTIVVASGDSGAAGCDVQGELPVATHGPAVQFPANLPEVTAMGGTQFYDVEPGTGLYWGTKNSTTGGSALGYIPEIVWNENDLAGGLGASGGGASATIAKPDWQAGAGVPADGARDTPDLALSSAGHDGYLITFQGNNLFVVGGTSAAAPTMSGVLALLNQYTVKKGGTAGLGNINPQLYRMALTVPTAFHDIVDGYNIVPCGQGSAGCLTGSYGVFAGPGYDLATGLGSIDANILVTSWGKASNPVFVRLTSDAPVVTLNDTITLVAVIGKGIDSATGAPLSALDPTGTVNFTSLQTSLGSAPIVTVNGLPTATLKVPAWLLGTGSAITVAAQYAGDAAFSSGGATITVKVTLPVSANVAAVAAAVTNPVFAFQTGNQPMNWQAGISLRELAGVPAVVTGFAIDGVPQVLDQVFPSPNIPAGGTLKANIVLTNLQTPAIKTFTFTGSDLGGNIWSRQIQVVFRGLFVESEINFNLWATPLTIQQNPAAATNCLYQQQVTLDETTGYELHLTGLLKGSVDISDTIPAVFGTTRLAPWGSLQGTICWTPAVTPSTDLLEVIMADDFGDQLIQEVNVNFTGPAAGNVHLSTSPASVALVPSPFLLSPNPWTFTVNLTDKTQPWTATVFPANRTTAWLSLSQYAGTGTAAVTLFANSAGFGPGVYRATITLQSPDSVPQSLAVPVMWVNGPTPDGPSISSVGNALSFTSPVSPGSIMAIYGKQLADVTLPAAGLPLTNSIAGVSVTVNGWPAPLFYVSPTQINAQVPYEVGAGPAVLGVVNSGLSFSAVEPNVGIYGIAGIAGLHSPTGGFQFQISPAAPGILTSNGSIYPASTAKQGGFATMYVTGAGEVSQSLPSGVAAAGTAASLPVPLLPVTVTVGGVPALVQFAGATPGVVGLIQVNFVVPDSVDPGAQPVVIIAGGYPSAAANLTVSAK